MFKRSLSVPLLAAVVLLSSTLLTPTAVCAAEFSTKIFRAAAIGAAVTAVSPQLNKFVNTITIQKLPAGTATKIVPILSVGEKGYIGAAQVAGPSTYVNQVKVVWAYENNFSQNEFRLKILFPSGSLNPLQLTRVQKVGVTAVIDVALDGRWKGETISRSIRTGDVIKAGAVAVAINAAAKPLNNAINLVTRADSSTTKVVPIISVGEKAYIGGVQVSGPSASVSAVKAAIMYEAIFDTGKYRVKVFVPSNSINPLSFKRVTGTGISAIIDTSIADQERVRQREPIWRSTRANYQPIDKILSDRFRGDIHGTPAPARHDSGLHKGWYIGQGNQRKMISGIWINRYNSLSPADKAAFVPWWNIHYKDKPDVLEKRWREWVSSRSASKPKYKPQPGRNNDDKGRGKGKPKKK